jgi:TetR/AcrR family transcriptional regulator, mexJK operon transcriptional repressor
MNPIPRNTPKRQRILDAARELFLAGGYEGTSMDAIQREVGGSKATLYAYFPSKEALFEAIVDGLGHQPLTLQLQRPGASPSAVLSGVAEKILQVLASPWFTRMQRRMIERAEASAVSVQAFFERGPGQSLRDLEAWLRAQHRVGTLHCPQPARSAELFLGMVQGLHLQRSLLGFSGPSPSERVVWSRYVVKTFLQLHRVS